MDAKTDLTKNDLDPTETQEWLDALAAVIGADGTDRAHFLLERMIESTRLAGGHLPFKYTTAYINTIPAHLEQSPVAMRRLNGNCVPTHAGTRLRRWYARIANRAK